MDVCFIVAYRRPECLAITLELIAKNKEFKTLQYLFVLDYGYDTENIPVIADWLQLHQIQHFKIFEVNTLVEGLGKQPYCFFKGYRKAMELAKQYVFMIEEDVAVSNRFFEWHYKIQTKEDVFCSIASLDSSKTFLNPSYDKYYLADRYHSLGVCFKKENILEILKHDKIDYYTKPFEYVKKTFPNSKKRLIHCEQAGVIWRIIENKYKVAFPTKGFAYHFGFYGQNRKSIKTIPKSTTLNNKIKWVKNIIFNKEKLKTAIQYEKHYLDSTPVLLNIEWNGGLNRIEI